jgi:TonB family protein
LIKTQDSAGLLSNADAKTGTVRLVIRARILSDASTPASGLSAPQNRRSLAIAVTVIVALALIWLGIGAFKHSSNSPPAAQARNAPPQASLSASSRSQSSASAPVPTKSAPTQVDAQRQSDAAMASVNEVLPKPSRGSLATIRGTIVISIRVVLNADGSVRTATSQIPGPSRYFERLALQSAKQWTFTPTHSQEPRTMFVRFDFTRDGVTARAAPTQT